MHIESFIIHWSQSVNFQAVSLSHVTDKDRILTHFGSVFLLMSRSHTSVSDDLCPWSGWSSCSRSCGAGVVSRHRHCLCEEAGDHTCPISVETDRYREETRLCYKRPCPGELAVQVTLDNDVHAKCLTLYLKANIVTFIRVWFLSRFLPHVMPSCFS